MGRWEVVGHPFGGQSSEVDDLGPTSGLEPFWKGVGKDFILPSRFFVVCDFLSVSDVSCPNFPCTSLVTVSSLVYWVSCNVGTRLLIYDIFIYKFFILFQDPSIKYIVKYIIQIYFYNVFYWRVLKKIERYLICILFIQKQNIYRIFNISTHTYIHI